MSFCPQAHPSGCWTLPRGNIRLLLSSSYLVPNSQENENSCYSRCRARDSWRTRAISWKSCSASVCVCVLCAGDKAMQQRQQQSASEHQELRLLPRTSKLADSFHNWLELTHLSGSRVCLSIHAFPVAKQRYWSETTYSGEQKSHTFNHNHNGRKMRGHGFLFASAYLRYRWSVRWGGGWWWWWWW